MALNDRNERDRLSNRRTSILLSKILQPDTGATLARKGWTLPITFKARFWSLLTALGDARLTAVDADTYFSELAKEYVASGFIGDQASRALPETCAYRSLYLDAIPVEAWDDSRPGSLWLLPNALFYSRAVGDGVARRRSLSDCLIKDRWPDRAEDDGRYEIEADRVCDALVAAGATPGWRIETRPRRSAKLLGPQLISTRGALSIEVGIRNDRRRLAIGVLDPVVRLSLGGWSVSIPDESWVRILPGVYLYWLARSSNDIAVSLRFLLDLLECIPQVSSLEEIDAQSV